MSRIANGTVLLYPWDVLTLQFDVAKGSSESRSADVHVTIQAPVEHSKNMISTYAPVGRTTLVNVRISTPRDVPAGGYELRLEDGRRERLNVSVILAATPDGQCYRAKDDRRHQRAALPDYMPRNVIDGDERSV